MGGAASSSDCQSSGRRVTRRQVLRGAAGLGAGAALGSVLVACGSSSGGGSTASSSPSAAASGTPKKGGSLKVGIEGGSVKETVGPWSLLEGPQIALSFQIYNRLLEYSPDFKLEKVLADSVEASPDAKVWTVRLRSDVAYSDGKSVTADDVVFSYQSIIDPKNPQSGATSLSMLKPSGIKKIDDRTVRFTLDTPNAIFPELLAYRENSIVRSDFDPKNPIGTGPFVLKSFTPGQQMEFVPNPNYFGEGPYVDQLTLIEFADPVARVNALLGGTVDQVTNLAATQAQTVTASPGYAVWDTDTGGWQPFTMRIDQTPFSDVRVRQAFRLIVDRQQMIDQALAGRGGLGNDMYAPYDPGYPKDLPQRVQDLEQAKSLLKQAGYDNNLNVELVTSTAVGGGAVEAAQVFAQQATGAGVTVKVNKTDPTVFYGDNYLKWTFADDFWGTRNYLAQTTQGSLPSAPYNETHWKNAKWQALVEEAFRTPDDAKRNQLVGEAATIEYNEGGYIIWSFTTLLDAYSDKIAGLVHDVFLGSAMGYRFHLVYFK
jgi:peptide/nickel transport system substrate-binding protein